MKDLIRLFKILQVTRAQPQYGYALSGLRKSDLSSLAEHHYLVTMIAWHIGRQLVEKGAKIDVAKIVEYCLIHDLGELFGSDISRHYGAINPEARKLAKAYETENQKFLSRYFSFDKEYYATLTNEIMDAQTDEGLIAKVADYLECGHYLKYLNLFKESDAKVILEGLVPFISKIKDPIAKAYITNFVSEWGKDSFDSSLPEVFYDSK